jgi:hypothetical protein
MSQKDTKTTPSQSSDNSAIDRKARQKDSEIGAPIEHYHGETTNKQVVGNGDLDEETLDKDAPFNKTYGRKTELD